MLKKFVVLLAFSSSLLALSGVALAQEKACLLEGSFTIGTAKTEIKDCLQNNGVPQTQFVETCGSLAQATKAFGGPAAKVTYMAACPAQSQGSCAGFFGQPMTSYYYKRDAKKLATSKSSCLAQGGKWQ
ncbi:hypothetical protein [Polaromonas sp.]|uniref:hypothetical protein n=1 Tax=Polaromonas sp. TaxID=1869339 RepID=UPI003265DBBD